MRSIEAISVRESNDLAGQMGRQAEVVRAAEQKLRELTEYLKGYAAEQAQKSQLEGVSAMQLTETHLFMEKLRHAVALQSETLEQARSNYEACRARWIAQRVRSSALGSAVHRFEEEEARELARREERIQDEVAARYHKTPKPG
jgi:flagellar export protein FliJ